MCENLALFMHLHRPLALAREIPTTGMMKVQLRWKKKKYRVEQIELRSNTRQTWPCLDDKSAKETHKKMISHEERRQAALQVGWQL